MRPVEDIERELAQAIQDRDYWRESDKITKAERDALARHVEVLRAPVTAVEADIADSMRGSARYDTRDILTEFIAARQRKAQFAAFGPALRAVTQDDP